MSKVLVKSAMYQYQMGPDGLQRYYTLGGSGRRAQPGEVRGRTKRDHALGLAGAMAGGALGLTGESRSLGGFAGNIISGAEQGSRFGRGLADALTSRTRQARADLIEGEKQARARSDAEARLAGEREMKRRRGLDLDPNMSLQELRDMGPTPRRRRVLPGIGGKNMTQFGYELAAHREEQEAIAAERARQQKELDKQGFKGDVRQFMEAQSKLPSQQVVDVVGSLAGTAAPVGQQQQVPQQIQPAEGGAQTQSDENNNAMGTGPQAVQSHTNASTENAEQEVQEQQGGGDEGVDSAMLDRLRGMMEDENE